MSSSAITRVTCAAPRPPHAAVGVTTGPYDAEGLWAAGADVVLDDLTQFAGWLSAHAALDQ